MSSEHLPALLCRLTHLTVAAQTRGLTDRQLLERFAAHREEEAFAALVQRHGPLVLGVCRRLLRHEQDAEDVFQATFLILARKAAVVTWRPSVGGWLHEVAARLACKARAQARQRRVHEQEAAIPSGTSTSNDPVTREWLAVLEEELHGLPEEYRLALVLCHLEGRPRAEAARQLGWSPRTLRRRLQAGRTLLRRRLARRGLTLPGGLLATTLAAREATAGVPALLSRAAVRTAVAFASRAASAGPLSGRAALLAEGVLRALSRTRWKAPLGLLLALGLLTSAAGLTAWQMAGAKPPAPDAPQAQAPGREAAGVGPPPVEHRLDQFGDPLPAGAAARLGTLRFYHGEQLQQVVFFPDGKRLASNNLRENRFWDVATGRELPVPKELTDARLLPARDRLLAVAREARSVGIWDAVAGKKLLSLELQPPGPAFGLSPDGHTLVWAQPSLGPDGLRFHLQFCDLATGRIEDSVRLRPADRVARFAFSRDGKTLAAQYSSAGIEVWDVATRSRRCSSPANEAGLDGPIALSSDGSTLATAPLGGRACACGVRARSRNCRRCATSRKPGSARSPSPRTASCSP
jgi:RNA polymerase sigma factor (sigma-70 family)